MLEEHAKRLSRPIHPMPEFVKNVLLERHLMEAYHARPPYQQNDYIGWISRTKLEKTQQKRLQIMLNELAAGQGYMGTGI
ncbi:MAG TPA: YdeI/OmpD-associated family protein [Dehalococcoidales bacterium]|nr:YdeI/OmpD-associated family protein [Dehalococcoidales bacterium]